MSRGKVPVVLVLLAFSLIVIGVQHMTVSAAAPAVLAFITPSRALSAGAGVLNTPSTCSAVITVQTQDPSLTPTTLGAVVQLTSTSTNGFFFPNSDCSGILGGTNRNTITIPAGSSSANFYYTDGAQGAPTITASSSGLTSAIQGELLEPPELAFTNAPQTMTTSVCSNRMIVQFEDAFGNPGSISNARFVSLMSTSTGGTFYTESGGTCGTAVSLLPVPIGPGYSYFHYIDTQTGCPTITGQSPGFDMASQIEFVSNSVCTGTATQLFTSAGMAISNGGTAFLGTLVYDAATVTGSSSATPSGTVSYTFWSNGACSGTGSPAGTVTLIATGAVPKSNTEGPLDVGMYSFQATYGGDVHYGGSTSPCQSFNVVTGSGSVGGTVIPLNKLALLTPFIVFGSLLIAVSLLSTLLLRRARKPAEGTIQDPPREVG